ncbi:MAG: hypothetical protein OXC28_20250 [Defluviicoccus sp.]|nr:hypothetical protein [Defluviicoccus sp.]
MPTVRMLYTFDEHTVAVWAIEAFPVTLRDSSETSRKVPGNDAEAS